MKRAQTKTKYRYAHNKRQDKSAAQLRSTSRNPTMSGQNIDPLLLSLLEASIKLHLLLLKKAYQVSNKIISVVQVDYASYQPARTETMNKIVKRMC